MFDMETIIEPDPVVPTSVIANALGWVEFPQMFAVTLHVTQNQTQQPAGKKHTDKKERFEPQQEYPQTPDACKFQDFVSRPSFFFDVFGFSCMVPQMAFFPQGLWNAHKQAQIQ